MGSASKAASCSATFTGTSGSPRTSTQQGSIRPRASRTLPKSPRQSVRNVLTLNPRQPATDAGRRGRVLSRTSRRHDHPDRLCPRGRRCSPAFASAITHDGGGCGYAEGRAGHRAGVELRRPARRRNRRPRRQSRASSAVRVSTVQVGRPQPRKSLSAVRIAASVRIAAATVGQSRSSRGTRCSAVSRACS